MRGSHALLFGKGRFPHEFLFFPKTFEPSRILWVLAVTSVFLFLWKTKRVNRNPDMEVMGSKCGSAQLNLVPQKPLTICCVFFEVGGPHFGNATCKQQLRQQEDKNPTKTRQTPPNWYIHRQGGVNY